MKKQFKDTKVGAFLQKAAPGVLDMIGDAVPGASLITNLVKGQIAPEQEEEFNDALSEYQLREREMLLKDTADARAMQVAALQQDDKFSKRFIYYLAIFWSVSAVVYIAWITFGTVPEANTRFADTILGFLLGTIVAAVIQFFFGSSAGSKEKDKKYNL